MALYHFLDPFWSRFPFPYQTVFHERKLGPLTAYEMARTYFGKTLYPVYVYVVGDTFVDSGVSCLTQRLIQIAKEKSIHRAVITHHHEDHSGGMKHLQRAGVEIHASQQTLEIMQKGFPIKFYEHMFFGKSPALKHGSILKNEIQMGKYKAQVLDAPGHCEDQVVFYIAEEGWLFSGDVFLGEKIKIFRQDEDFIKTIQTLQKLLKLDFEILYCAHQPRIKYGKNAIKTKLDFLLDLQDRVMSLHQKGFPVTKIMRELKLPKTLWQRIFSGGDGSCHNLVSSIIQGPKPRKELKKYHL